MGFAISGFGLTGVDATAISFKTVGRFPGVAFSNWRERVYCADLFSIGEHGQLIYNRQWFHYSLMRVSVLRNCGTVLNRISIRW